MNKNTLIAIVLALLFATPSCNAQLLKNLKKGAEKALDNAAKKIVDGAVGTAKYIFTDPNNPDNKGGVPDNLKSINVEGREIEVKETEDKSTKPPFKMASGTRQVPCEDPSVVATSMSEGIFAVNRNGVYTFYTFEGTPVTDGKWLTGTSSYREPLMSKHGIIMAKQGEEYGKPLYLIDRYGKTTQLPAEIKSSTNFVDSLAIAVVNGKNQFIDKHCKVVYPDIHPLPARIDGVNHTVARLREGRRAFLDQATHKWGFIDKNGNIVIKPQYQEVRSFKEGFAMVKDENGRFYFINDEGQQAFEPEWPENVYMNSVSDFDSGICAVDVGYMDDARFTYYYNALGKFIGKAPGGSAFHQGQAYCHDKNPDAENDPYKEPPYKTYYLSKEIKKQGAVANLDIFIPEVNTEKPVPWYDAKDVAHISDRNTIGDLGNPEYFYDYSLGKYSKCGYAHFEMQMPDGTYYKGFVDTSGKVAIIYSVHTPQSTSLD